MTTAAGAPWLSWAPAAVVQGVKGRPHSHSMVPGGLEVQSRTTRLTSGTELVMRVEIRAKTS